MLSNFDCDDCSKVRVNLPHRYRWGKLIGAIADRDCRRRHGFISRATAPLLSLVNRIVQGAGIDLASEVHLMRTKARRG